MQRLTSVVLATLLLGLLTGARKDRPEEPPRHRFQWIDVYVDAKGAPLAAYQFELSAPRDQISIAGIEGGEHAAFEEAPYYDLKAIQSNRAIVAAFNTGTDLPAGKTRVATVHVMVTGPAEPEYDLKLTVAAASDGTNLPAAISFEKGERR
jgi:hypothetical protein